MAFIDWTEKEDIQVKIIDEQHKYIATTLNRLHKVLGEDAKCSTYMKELEYAIRTHFETEEKLMTENKYDGFFSHKLEHDRMLSKIENYNIQMARGEAHVHLELIKSIRNWLINHLELNDRKVGIYLNSIGIN